MASPSLPQTGRLAAVLMLVHALASSSAAAAATPPVVDDPSSGTIATGRPQFTWTPGPAGEQVTVLSLARSPEFGPDGNVPWTSGGRQVAVEAGATSARVRVPLHAGTWWWTASWRAADSDPAPTSGVTQPRSFVIRPTLGAIRGTYVQFSTTPTLLVRGSLSSNLRVAMVTCSLYRAGRMFATRRVRIRPRSDRRTPFRCPRLSISERIDGQVVSLRVVARGAGRRSVAVSRFEAT